MKRGRLACNARIGSGVGSGTEPNFNSCEANLLRNPSGKDLTPPQNTPISYTANVPKSPCSSRRPVLRAAGCETYNVSWTGPMDTEKWISYIEGVGGVGDEIPMDPVSTQDSNGIYWSCSAEHQTSKTESPSASTVMKLRLSPEKASTWVTIRIEDPSAQDKSIAGYQSVDPQLILPRNASKYDADCNCIHDPNCREAPQKRSIHKRAVTLH
ncbi:hypothetical protein T439DRAFT_333371 [Meredithblackwellia eburnea MCA 4105]